MKKKMKKKKKRGIQERQKREEHRWTVKSRTIDSFSHCHIKYNQQIIMIIMIYFY